MTGCWRGSHSSANRKQPSLIEDIGQRIAATAYEMFPSARKQGARGLGGGFFREGQPTTGDYVISLKTSAKRLERALDEEDITQGGNSRLKKPTRLCGLSTRTMKKTQHAMLVSFSVEDGFSISTSKQSPISLVVPVIQMPAA
jgi:hypothetical protein